MIYFKNEERKNLINKNKKAKFLFVIFSMLFILLTILFIFLKVLIAEILLSTIYFSYLLCFFQIYQYNNRIIELYNKMDLKEKIVDAYIEKVLDIITINHLQFYKVIVKIGEQQKQLYLFANFNISLKENIQKRLIISNNYIKGELDYEEIIS